MNVMNQQPHYLLPQTATDPTAKGPFSSMQAKAMAHALRTRMVKPPMSKTPVVPGYTVKPGDLT